MDGEIPRAYRQATPVAHKEHTCCECGGIIEVGETYYVYSGVWDSGPETFKTCTDCNQLREAVDEGSRLDELTPFMQLGEVCHASGVKGFAERFDAIWDKRRRA